MQTDRVTRAVGRAAGRASRWPRAGIAIAALAWVGFAFPALAEPAQADQRFYPLCSELVPPSVWAKHLAGMSWQPSVVTDSWTACEFSDGRRGVTVTYACSKGQSASRPKLEPTQVEVPGLGRFAYRANGSDGPSLHVVDDDTPCVISLFPKGGIGAEALVPLARDLVKTATSQVVERGTVEGLVWVVDPAEDPMAPWQREGASVTAIFTLPQGFPKPAELPARVAQGKPRKALVLAYLQHGSMFDSALPGVHPFLPQIAVERFAADGRPTTTPQALLNLGIPKIAKVQQQQRLAVAFANSGQPTYPDDLLIVFLRDANQRLLDWKRVDILKEAADAKKVLDPKRPEQERTSPCNWSVDEAGQGIVAKIVCPRNPDPLGHVKCKEDPSWTLRWQIGAKDDKLKIDRKRIAFKGKGCEEEYYD